MARDSPGSINASIVPGCEHQRSLAFQARFPRAAQGLPQTHVFVLPQCSNQVCATSSANNRLLIYLKRAVNKGQTTLQGAKSNFISYPNSDLRGAGATNYCHPEGCFCLFLRRSEGACIIYYNASIMEITHHPHYKIYTICLNNFT
ncbi:hypothetical protein J2W42_000974 [Rhizobium tibeticum]|uniref:Uncharacterized protein n=1 Tax=Rhizobium tibeticum TaxID=501024 RepID=A0A1H8CZ78_9HYPH|nr:hypothetical protein [Rhizobium tibeticum]SEH50817.1 hypothetical protein RTCCBAU85039_0807 [Rhizobium tibeticum]SEN00310.1 hypothetical protein SAMN05216228_1001359 [Rhizobium tibeticum]